MQRYNTLKSLEGLRIGVTLADTKMHDAELCAKQLIGNHFNKCLRAENISVFARLSSILYQGIDITLVPINDTSWGVWQQGNLLSPLH